MNDLDTLGQRVRCFGAAGWGMLERHPLGELLTDGEDWDAGMARRGWSLVSRIGRAGASGEGSPLPLLVFRRPSNDGTPQFLIEVSETGETFEDVFVEDVGCLMRLLVSWSPALEASALARLSCAVLTERWEPLSQLA